MGEAADDVDRHSDDDGGEVSVVASSPPRLLSAYTFPQAVCDTIGAPNDRLWIITEADRSAATILWPSEY